MVTITDAETPLTEVGEQLLRPPTLLLDPGRGGNHIENCTQPPNPIPANLRHRSASLPRQRYETRRPELGSRLAAGHPQGLALTPARTAPHSRSREQRSKTSA
jgi:hypothetical protein